MSLFAKATETAAAKSEDARPTRNTTWVVGDPKGDAVAKAVHELVKLTAEEKAIAAKKKMAATVVLNVAKQHHVRDFAELGVPPDTPMCVQNSDGEKVTFIVADRSGQYKASPDQMSALEQLLGSDVASGLTFTETNIGLDRTILSLPGVSKVIEKALDAVIKKLIKAEKLTDDQAGELITASQKTAFKPGTVERAAMICGQDQVKLSGMLDAMGSSCTRYIKT